MKKILIALISIIILILLAGMISAEVEPLPKGKCFWIREGIDNGESYRPERTFQGVWGRFSDGSIKCFSPGSTRKPTPETTTTSMGTGEPEEPEPECITRSDCGEWEICVDGECQAMSDCQWEWRPQKYCYKVCYDDLCHLHWHWDCFWKDRLTFVCDGE